MSLREAQRKLAVVFTHPRGVRAGLAAAGFDGKRPVTDLVADRPPVPLHTRLAVYSDAYFLRLADCLGEDFRAVKRALGPDDFRRLAADYLESHPSRSPFINDIGAAFAAFVEKHPVARRLPFLPELAALERTALEALFADRLPSTNAPIGPASRFRLDPSARLMTAAWPVERLWEARHRPGLGRLAKPARRRLLIFRDDWVRVAALGEAEFKILDRLRAGKTLSQALKGLERAITPARTRRLFSLGALKPR